MPPYGLYSLTDRVNLPEELGAEGYRYIDAFSPGLDPDFRRSLYQYDPAFGQLNASQRYLPAPYTGEMPFQAMFDVSPTFYGKANMGFDANLYNPSFGGVSGYRDTGGIMGIQQEDEDEEDQLLYSGVGDMRYQTPRTIADQNRILGQTFTQQQPNFFQRMLSGASDMYGSGRDLIGTGIGSLMSLASGIPGLGLLMGLINPNPQSAIDTRRLQQAGYGTQLQSIYGPGGIMQGYNPVSMFGRGPLESIINRRNKAKSETAIQKLNQAITDLGGSTDKNLSDYRASRPASERRSTGFGKSGMGRDPDKFK